MSTKKLKTPKQLRFPVVTQQNKKRNMRTFVIKVMFDWYHAVKIINLIFTFYSQVMLVSMNQSEALKTLKTVEYTPSHGAVRNTTIA